ncbi:M48 family metallopeptidase [Sphingomonas sp. TZW2008]|uniref:M48 family metallopeptidase n=1 Tax=Sphingomonas sp. TZW2008 TaxID=1917973 RepID=UPI00211A337B|nr:M48 family metallopeptidase [Sphingomonas sp. TZW2008]
MKIPLSALAAAALVIAASANAATKAKVQPAPPPPPYAGAYQPQGVDEIGMWKEDDEDERRLANSPLVIHDPTLNGYVKNVLCGTVGVDRCKATRVYILRTPLFNATMSPNGTMRVYSGLLLRMRDEAELASVLGHEFGHYESRHSLSRFRAARSGNDLLSWAAVLASMSGTYAAAANYDSLQLSVYGGLYRYQRDNEREADMLGLGYLNTSSLPPQSAAKVWRNVMAEAEASATSRGLKKPRFDSIAFFASHPPEAERAEYLAALAVPDGASRDTGARRYAAALARWLPLFLDDQVKLNDFGGSEYIINSLAENGWTAPLWSARGDLYRARGNQRDLVNAAEFYGNAVALDPKLAEAQRGLGLSLIKTGRREEGRAALSNYLSLKPDASDAAIIGMLVQKEAN